MAIEITQENLNRLRGLEPIVKSVYLLLLTARKKDRAQVNTLAMQQELKWTRGGAVEKPGLYLCVSSVTTLQKAGIIECTIKDNDISVQFN